MFSDGHRLVDDEVHSDHVRKHGVLLGTENVSTVSSIVAREAMITKPLCSQRPAIHVRWNPNRQDGLLVETSILVS